MKQTPLEALEALFADAQASTRRGPVPQGPARRPEPIRQLPLHDSQFYLIPAKVATVNPLPKRPYPSACEAGPLSFPAPHREAVRLESGAWTDRPWSFAAVHRYRLAGGYFLRGQHEFASRDAARLAYAESFDEAPPGEAPPTHTPSEADLILETLFAERAATPTTWR